ncbi:MAG: ribosome small subunit-dependent GTPase A [Chlorobi bacterium]|nr:ribosome small subunit-dependent GTPase A [Chlorobiota bacterium]
MKGSTTVNINNQTTNNSLETLGWNDFFRAGFQEFDDAGLQPARVVAEHRNGYALLTTQGEFRAELSGRLRHSAADRSQLPAVGDWVAVAIEQGGDMAIIHGVLPRRSAFSRNAVGGRTEQQIIAANIDALVIVTGLDNNFNVRRIERYLTAAWDSGATPIVVLNKADQCPNLDERIAEVEGVAIGTTVIAISALEGVGIGTLREHLRPGVTAALVGSSGVGKSTIINQLIGQDRQATGSTSQSVGKGKHTTTHRELIPLPNGAILMDTPGMRELQLWGGNDDGVSEIFGDIEELAASCRFSDCRHEGEPGCAVGNALRNGQLNPSRFENYRKLQRELAYQNRRQDEGAMRAEKERWKKLSKQYRNGPHRP